MEPSQAVMQDTFQKLVRLHWELSGRVDELIGAQYALADKLRLIGRRISHLEDHLDDLRSVE